MSDIDIGKLDPAMAVKPANLEGVAWYLPYETPMQLLGFNWFDVDHKYARLPIAGRPATITRFPNGVKTVIKAEECGAISLSYHTAGGQIRFRTDSSQFLIHADLLATYGMDHMAFTGSAGFDIYLKCKGVWKCFGVTRTNHAVTEFTTTVTGGLKREMRDVIINFPLYNGVKSLAIGLDEDAALEAPTPFADPRPIVFYGTSITQGGCATRPGMASSNIMSRMLERPVINLGFSGNGKGEPEIAQMLADVKEPALYILDYPWNTSEKELEVTLPNVIAILRKAHPVTPILLVSPTPGRDAFEEYENTSKLPGERDIMCNAAARLRAEGDANIYFFDAFNDSLGEDFWETLVDGCHATDMGFYRFSQAICPLINDILKPEK